MVVLVIAPHADDESLGVGGTIARYARQGHDVYVAVMTGPGEGEHPIFPRSDWDTIRAEAREACKILGVKKLIFREIPAALVSDEPMWKVNREVASVLNEVQPDVLYVPFPFDLHKDHRQLYYACSVAWRPISTTGFNVKEVYAYEVPSETHWNAPYLEPGFLPNVWIDISQTLEAKLAALRCYKSQMKEFPDVRSVEAVEALAKLRGSQMSMRAAEAFVLIRKLEHMIS